LKVGVATFALSCAEDTKGENTATIRINAARSFLTSEAARRRDRR
jgi:hypothetical protein